MARTSSPKRAKSADKMLGANRKTGALLIEVLSIEVLKNL
jgi:hypothetical protein